MAPGRRRDLIASRRRRADDGDGEDVEADSVGTGSQSDGSVLSENNDSHDEGSASHTRGQQTSAEDQTRSEQKDVAIKCHPPNHGADQSQDGALRTDTKGQPNFASTTDTEAMMNGINPPANGVEEESVDFEASADPENSTPASGRHNAPGETETPQAPTAPQSSVTSAAAARPHPPSVPSRGGFFMHDQRDGNFGQGGPGRGQGRGRGGPGAMPFFGQMQQPMKTKGGRWDHDLHETVKEGPPMDYKTTNSHQIRPQPLSNPHAGSSASMSKTVTVGLVTLRLSLPGMAKPVVYEKMPLKHHTRLPDLRPPLRRDKPVRIAVPDQPPRYIFPSVERSFIFIPRTQRPNQQGGRMRNRGYLSQYGSRRNSGYGGSNYTPSVAMSRRSSMARDGVMSPAGSIASRPPVMGPSEPTRPIVKLPAGVRPPEYAIGNPAVMTPESGSTPSNGVPAAPPYPLPSRPAFRENRGSQLTMHQPRPQKAVSVATIESPNPAGLHAPQQQEEQPFHHQVPAHMNGQGQQLAESEGYGQGRHLPMNGGPGIESPASGIPDRAVNAQPFQPGQMPVFYPSSYPMQNMFYYPPAEGGAMMYAGEGMTTSPMYMAGPQQGGYLVPLLVPPGSQGGPQGAGADGGAFAHESNGTVYYYDPSQMGPNHEGGMGNEFGGGGTVKEGEEHYYYPGTAGGAPMMYYPTQ